MLKCHGTPASAVDERAICQWNQGPWQRPCWQSRNWDAKCKYVWLGSFDLFSTAHHENPWDSNRPRCALQRRCAMSLWVRPRHSLLQSQLKAYHLHVEDLGHRLRLIRSWSALHALNFPLTSYFAALWSSLGAWTDSVCSLPALVYRHLVDAQQNMCHNWRKGDAVGRAVWVRSGNGPDTLSDRNFDKFWLDVLKGVCFLYIIPSYSLLFFWSKHIKTLRDCIIKITAKLGDHMP